MCTGHSLLDGSHLGGEIDISINGLSLFHLNTGIGEPSAEGHAFGNVAYSIFRSKGRTRLNTFLSELVAIMVIISDFHIGYILASLSLNIRCVLSAHDDERGRLHRVVYPCGDAFVLMIAFGCLDIYL